MNGARRRLPLVGSALIAAIAIVACFASAVGAIVLPAADGLQTQRPILRGLETGDLSKFDDASAQAGAVNVVTAPVYSGVYAAQTSYEGGGAPGFARGAENVNWRDGEDVWYGAAYYLPAGFETAQQSDVHLLGWDNERSYGADADFGGVVVSGSDKRARLVRGKRSGTSETVVGPFDLPVGRWFVLDAHQRLSEGRGVSEVFIDGERVGRTIAPNTYGRPIQQVAFGILSVAQEPPLEVYFDRAAAQESEIGYAGLETADLGEFSQDKALNGSISASDEQAADGRYSAKAVYEGGTSNGYARGIFDVGIANATEAWYGAAFYLPPGFYDAMEGYIDIMRWDNWPSFTSAGESGGIAIYGSDQRARLVTGGYSQDNRVLVGPFDLPEGQWFTLNVRQCFHPANAINEVYLDGELVGSSSAGNTDGRPVERMRYGIVAIDAGQQTQPLTLYFDNAFLTARAFGPLGCAGLVNPSGPVSESQ